MKRNSKIQKNSCKYPTKKKVKMTLKVWLEQKTPVTKKSKINLTKKTMKLKINNKMKKWTKTNLKIT